jgi:hypothetical protein
MQTMTRFQWRQRSAARNDLSVLTVPAFKDNYLWLIHDGVMRQWSTPAMRADPGGARRTA